MVHRKCSSKFLVLSIGKEMGLKEGGGGVAESFMVFVLFGVELFNFGRFLSNYQYVSSTYREVASLKSPTMLQ